MVLSFRREIISVVVPRIRGSEESVMRNASHSDDSIARKNCPQSREYLAIIAAPIFSTLNG